jgi:sugar lactone lactonase YvrE
MAGIGLRQVLKGTDIVGESLVWDAERECLLWVDIVGRRIRRHHPRSDDECQWVVEEFPTSIGLRDRRRRHLWPDPPRRPVGLRGALRAAGDAVT